MDSMANSDNSRASPAEEIYGSSQAIDNRSSSQSGPHSPTSEPAHVAISTTTSVPLEHALFNKLEMEAEHHEDVGRPFVSDGIDDEDQTAPQSGSNKHMAIDLDQETRPQSKTLARYRPIDEIPTFEDLRRKGEVHIENPKPGHLRFPGAFDSDGQKLPFKEVYARPANNILPPADQPLWKQMLAYCQRWSIWAATIKNEERRAEVLESISKKMREAWEFGIAHGHCGEPNGHEQCCSSHSGQRGKKISQAKDRSRRPVDQSIQPAPFTCDGSKPLYAIINRELEQAGITVDEIHQRITSEDLQAAEELLHVMCSRLDRPALVVSDWASLPSRLTKFDPRLHPRNLLMFCLFEVQRCRGVVAYAKMSLARSSAPNARKGFQNRIDTNEQRANEHLILALMISERPSDEEDDAEEDMPQDVKRPVRSTRLNKPASIVEVPSDDEIEEYISASNETGGTPSESESNFGSECHSVYDESVLFSKEMMPSPDPNLSKLPLDTYNKSLPAESHDGCSLKETSEEPDDEQTSSVDADNVPSAADIKQQYISDFWEPWLNKRLMKRGLQALQWHIKSWDEIEQLMAKSGDDRESIEYRHDQFTSGLARFSKKISKPSESLAYESPEPEQGRLLLRLPNPSQTSARNSTHNTSEPALERSRDFAFRYFTHTTKSERRKVDDMVQDYTRYIRSLHISRGGFYVVFIDPDDLAEKQLAHGFWDMQKKEYAEDAEWFYNDEARPFGFRSKEQKVSHEWGYSVPRPVPKKTKSRIIRKRKVADYEDDNDDGDDAVPFAPRKHQRINQFQKQSKPATTSRGTGRRSESSGSRKVKREHHDNDSNDDDGDYQPE